MSWQVARLRLLGLLFWLAGGTAITLGWAGTAQVACVDCQVPYLISGAAGGIALIIAGTGLLVIAQLRVEGNRIAERLAPPADRETDPGAPTTPPAAGAPGSSWSSGSAGPGDAPTERVLPLAIADPNAR